jgi:hypothetical protein
MSRRRGTEVKPSWALSFCHILYIARRLRNALTTASSEGSRHELICAGLANLLGYLGWLRGTELFSIDHGDVTIIEPADGPLHELPPNVGAILINLLAETKTNACQVADVVMAYQTLSGLSLRFWFHALYKVCPTSTGPLFYTATEGQWSSRYFRERYAWPILEEMRTHAKEPSLQMFGDEKGNRIADKVYSIHSWEPDDLGCLGARGTMSRTLVAHVKPPKQRCTSMVDGLTVQIAAGKPLTRPTINGVLSNDWLLLCSACNTHEEGGVWVCVNEVTGAFVCV